MDKYERIAAVDGSPFVREWLNEHRTALEIADTRTADEVDALLSMCDGPGDTARTLRAARTFLMWRANQPRFTHHVSDRIAPFIWTQGER